MKNVIFIAPPAAGKGTQSEKLISLGYTHLSTGNMLREEINKKTKLGLEIESIISSGGLVSDDIVFSLIKDKLKTTNKPFILDGFPRTINQAKLLDNLFQTLNISDYEVIYLNITLTEALKRALGRLTCECGASYNKFYDNLKPKKEGICDKCGQKLILRNDDNASAFQKRFETFTENIQEIIEFYQNIGKLHIIDTNNSNTIITEKIKEILK